MDEFRSEGIEGILEFFGWNSVRDLCGPQLVKQAEEARMRVGITISHPKVYDADNAVGVIKPVLMRCGRWAISTMIPRLGWNSCRCASSVRLPARQRPTIEIEKVNGQEGL